MLNINKWITAVTMAERLNVARHAGIGCKTLHNISAGKKTTISRARLIHEGAAKYAKHAEPPSVKSMIGPGVARDAVWFSGLKKRRKTGDWK